MHAEEIVYQAYDLPPETQRLLRLAAGSYGDFRQAERYLHQALASAPDRMEVYIGLYRFYFYRNRLSEALRYAVQCMEKAARDAGLPADWRQVRREMADFHGFGVARFYLYTLKAYG